MNPFLLPPAIDFTAVFFVGISGALVAVRRGYDIVGIFFLALITSLGGAFLRDGIFLQNGPPAVVSDERYILLILAATIIGTLFRNKMHKVGRLVSLMDAVGLAAYAVLGTTKALSAGIPVSGSILVGVVNAVGGGMLRDLCTREEPMVFRPGEFYALVAFFGATAYALLVKNELMDPTQAAYLCIILMLITRFLTIALNWKTRSFQALYGDGVVLTEGPFIAVRQEAAEKTAELAARQAAREGAEENPPPADRD